jgi:two-component system invasion response regulator UvrY
MINVLLADDHELVREGIKQLLNGDKDIAVIVEASNGAEAVSKYQQFHTDIVILDISMPVLDGLEAAKQIMAEDPEAKILILTVHPEEQYAVRVLKAGARGYITKGTTAKELYRAVRMVAHGQRYLSEGGLPSILTQLLDTKISLSPVQRLSDRELQVLRLIAEGVKTSEIARTLRLNTKTVETYRTRLMNKLDIKTNAALVLFAQRNGFV